MLTNKGDFSSDLSICRHPLANSFLLIFFCSKMVKMDEFCMDELRDQVDEDAPLGSQGSPNIAKLMHSQLHNSKENEESQRIGSPQTA